VLFGTDTVLKLRVQFIRMLQVRPEEPVNSVKLLHSSVLLQCAFVVSLLAQLQCCVWAHEENQKISPEAKRYLLTALKLIQSQSISRDKIDFIELKKKTFEHADGAKTTQDTYPAVRYAVSQLPDHHSCHLPPVGQTDSSANLNASRKSKRNQRQGPANQEAPSGHMIVQGGRKIGYISVPGVIGYELAPLEEYAFKLRETVATLNNGEPKGWIIDLRENKGGNNWPMLGGIGPLLGARVIGFFAAPQQKRSTWIYEDDKAYGTGEWFEAISAARGGKVTIDGVPPVAVLIGRHTCSAGEIVAIAFKGRPNTRFFGENTGGATTAVHLFPLSDGALLGLAVANDEDRNGNLYPDSVHPDQYIESKVEGQSDDPVVAGAASWLLDRKQ
jgi:carboxyl-terminal processing protease